MRLHRSKSNNRQVHMRQIIYSIAFVAQAPREITAITTVLTYDSAVPTLIEFYTVQEGLTENHESDVYALVGVLAPDCTAVSSSVMCSTLVFAGSLRFTNAPLFATKVRMDVVLEACHSSCQDVKVSSVVINGRCGCNGHADTCWAPDNTSARTCQCQHGTTGRFCEKCLPMYNNMPYMQGTTGANECEQCDCNNHEGPTGSCTYNVSLGYGTCDICVHNTMGLQCNDCLDTFYRNASVAPSDPQTCVPCACGEGSINASCHQEQVPNSTTMVGQCNCKRFVDGVKCDRCEAGYFSKFGPCT